MSLSNQERPAVADSPAEGGDSNPRRPKTSTLRGRPIRPLWHPSVDEGYRRQRESGRDALELSVVDQQQRFRAASFLCEPRRSAVFDDFTSELVTSKQLPEAPAACAAKTSTPSRLLTIAPAHITHGSRVTTSRHSSRCQLPMTFAASRNASTSAGKWVAG